MDIPIEEFFTMETLFFNKKKEKENDVEVMKESDRLRKERETFM